MWLLLCATLALADTASELFADVSGWRSGRAAVGAPPVDEATYRKALADGEALSGLVMVDGVAAGKGWGVKVINQPVAMVWKAINDERHHPGALPIRESRVVSGTPRASGRIIYQYIDLPVVDDRWWLSKISFNASLYRSTSGRVWEMTWVDVLGDADLRASLDADLFDEGVPVAFSKGSWMLVSIDENHTLLEYYNWSDPGGMIPAGAASRFSNGSVKDTLDAIDKLATTTAPASKDAFYAPDGARLP